MFSRCNKAHLKFFKVLPFILTLFVKTKDEAFQQLRPKQKQLSLIFFILMLPWCCRTQGKWAFLLQKISSYLKPPAQQFNQ